MTFIKYWNYEEYNSRPDSLIDAGSQSITQVFSIFRLKYTTHYYANCNWNPKDLSKICFMIIIFNDVSYLSYLCLRDLQLPIYPYPIKMKKDSNFVILK